MIDDNNETYKYYIDFASRFGLPYILLDEGWTKTTQDILHSNPDIDIPEPVAYGRKKNVDLILWVLWNPLNEKLNEALDLTKAGMINGKPPLLRSMMSPSHLRVWWPARWNEFIHQVLLDF